MCDLIMLQHNFLIISLVPRARLFLVKFGNMGLNFHSISSQPTVRLSENHSFLSYTPHL